MTIFFRSLLYFLIFILLQACTSGGIAPVSNRNEIKDTPPNISKPSKNTENNNSIYKIKEFADSSNIYDENGDAFGGYRNNRNFD